MKTSNVLASLLFGSMAAAAPLKARDYVTKTNLVVETVVVYTTVWNQPAPTAQAAETTSAGGFYEQPKPKSSSVAAATSEAAASSAPAYTAPAASSAAVESSSAPAAVASSTSVYTPPAASSTPASSAPASSAPAASSTVPQAASSVASSSGAGETYSGSLTENPYGGGTGACGEAIQDTDMVVALGEAGFGASTYNSQTGAATNEWCGKSIKISYNGGSPVTAKIMDRCPGCSQWGLDATDAVWKALLGDEAYTRTTASWWVE